MKQNKKAKSKAPWILVGIIAVLLAAPNGTFIKILSDHLHPLVLNSVRYGIVALVMLPYIIAIRKRITKKNIKYAILTGICLAIAAFSYVTAIQMSQASYVSIIGLLLPIMFVIYSVFITKEKVHRRSVAGITLAALGAFTIVALPILITQGDSFVFEPVATLFALADCIFFPLAIIFSRKANEQGIPIMATFGIASLIVSIASTIAVLLFVGAAAYVPVISNEIYLPIFYTAIIVTLVSYSLNVASYERIGSIASSGLTYIESLFAILIPVVFLHEHLSSALVFGAILMLAGVYLAETQHHVRLHKHLRVMRQR